METQSAQQRSLVGISSLAIVALEAGEKQSVPIAVEGILDTGSPQLRHRHPYLMGTPCPRLHLYPGVEFKRLFHPVAGDAFLSP